MNEISILSCALLFFVTTFLIYRKIAKRKYRLPPGPYGVPILGYIPFLGKEPFKTLETLKEKYGNVFSLYLGLTHVVILGDNEAVKDGFGKPTTADRPQKMFDFLPGGFGFGGANGMEWSEQRKFCLRSMGNFGLGKSKWESMIQAEIEDFVKHLSSFKGQGVEISQALSSSLSNNISSFVFGKRLSRDDPDRIFLDSVLGEIMLSFNQDNIYNYFPIIRNAFVALDIGECSKTYHNLQKFNNFVRKEISKYRKPYQSKAGENLIADYMKEMEHLKDKPGHHFNDANLIGNIQVLFTGGSDTTSISIYWLLLAMASFPEIQDEVHKELDSVFGKCARAKWSDRNEIPYAHAVVMEGQRWRTVAPLNTARRAMEDVKIHGYDVPKGTTIIGNNWGLHHDKKYWKNPEIFDPTRFLAEDGKIITKPESYVPFSYGKRSCPAEPFAMRDILLYFVSLMQAFAVLPDEGRKLNLIGQLGLTYHPPKQELRFIPRA